MSALQSRLLVAVIFVASATLVVQIAGNHEAASQDRAISHDPDAQELARLRARFEAGPFLQSSRPISEREIIEVIVIPESYSPDLDTRCVVHQNTESRMSTITCSGPKFRPTLPGN